MNIEPVTPIIANKALDEAQSERVKYSIMGSIAGAGIGGLFGGKKGALIGGSVGAVAGIAISWITNMATAQREDSQRTPRQSPPLSRSHSYPKTEVILDSLERIVWVGGKKVLVPVKREPT